MLESAGWSVASAATATHGLRVAKSIAPDIILLDLGLPDGDGKDIVPFLLRDSAVGVIVVSARHLDLEKVAALDAGADDYVDKPFNIDELMARIRAAERRLRTIQLPGGLYRAGDLMVDRSTRKVTLEEQTIKLSPKEFDLLCELASHAGQVVTHKRLLLAGWGDPAIDQQYLRSYIALLRQKLEEDPSEPRLIKSEPGVGYRLAVLSD